MGDSVENLAEVKVEKKLSGVIDVSYHPLVH